MYGKINEKGKLTIYRDSVIELDGIKYINPNKRVLAAIGYKPIVPAEIPEIPKGMALTVDYVDDGECIKTVYGLVGGAI